MSVLEDTAENLYLIETTRIGVRTCGNDRCQRAFVPQRRDAGFCSLSCQAATKTREWRQKKREAGEMVTVSDYRARVQELEAENARLKAEHR